MMGVWGEVGAGGQGGGGLCFIEKEMERDYRICQSGA